MLGEQFGFGLLALDEQVGQVVFRQPERDFLHLLARGEQHQRADGGAVADELGQPFDNGVGVGDGVFGAGADGREVEFALFGKVKRAFEGEGGGLRQPC